MTQEAPKGWSDALALATARHGEALRKGGGRVPYVTHVVAVAETLAYHYPERDDLIVAGLLHDVVEDTSTTLHEVRWRFGDAVADLVRAVSKDDAAMERANGWTVADRTAGMSADERRAWLWRARREFMLAHLRPPADEHDEDAKDVFRLKAADAHANLGAIARDLRNVGPSVWGRFKVGREESLWFYRSIVERVEGAIGEEALARELREAFDGLEAA
jgi:GTP pyrophosphokinase